MLLKIGDFGLARIVDPHYSHKVSVRQARSPTHSDEGLLMAEASASEKFPDTLQYINFPCFIIKWKCEIVSLIYGSCRTGGRADIYQFRRIVYLYLSLHMLKCPLMKH
ncbi:hypothetical protein AMECASPLE_019135 [Ameca splendens]|uniref:Protein kinase domain-containing protein n=1 Tax=Ameca splendens TaxID=208324 RepID=A0ABV0ZZ93_9TELE